MLDFDIYSYLVSQHELQFFEDDAETAADQLNEMLHYVNALRHEEDTLEQLEEVIRRVLYEWIENEDLLTLDSDDMQSYILEQLEDVRQQEPEDDDY